MKNPLRVTRFACVVISLAAFAVGPAEGIDYGVNHYILGCANACSNLSGPVVFGGDVDATFTGSWYDPTQSGQGLSLEILPDKRLLLFWFTFNPDGTQQTWLVGNGTYSRNVATIPSVEMPTGGRWIPNFDPNQVANNAWGTLTLTFDDSEHGKVEFKSALGYGTGRMNLTRLTRPAGITTTALSAAGKAWIPAANLHTPRVGHTATPLADGRVLVAGGIGPDGFMQGSAELYDPAAGTWTLAGSMTRPRIGHTATTLRDGRVLVVEGDGAPNMESLGLLGTAELYDPVTGRWSPTGNVNTPRVAFTATLLDTGKVLIAGGVDNSDNALTSAELYDPESGTWTFTGTLAYMRFLHTASALPDGRVFVTGGWDDDFFQTTTATAELYDPVAGTWSKTASLHGSRVYHTATVLKNGNVLVAGGYNSAPPGGVGVYVPTSFSDAQIYDTSTGNWTIVGSLTVAREGHSATPMPDGTVLVTGGVDWPERRSHQFIANADLFDPVTGTWADGGVLREAHAYHSATLLQNGNVLIVGGSASDNVLANEELYANVPVTAAAGMTGAWYDPAQPGHGLVVEALPGNQMLATWFAFNPAGTEQSWFLGVGNVGGNTATITSVVQPTGGRFIPNFDPSKIINNAWGTLTLTFTDCDHGKVDFASTAGYGNGSMNLTRLTRPAGVVCP